jgi:hypothetical protein
MTTMLLAAVFWLVLHLVVAGPRSRSALFSCVLWLPGIIGPSPLWALG